MTGNVGNLIELLLTVEAHVIAACYSSDGNVGASTSAALIQALGNRATRVRIVWQFDPGYRCFGDEAGLPRTPFWSS